MFPFLTRGRSRRRPIIVPKARLSVERLESRNCPSSLAVYVYASPEPNHIAHVYGGVMGKVEDIDSGLPVVLGGVVNATVYTDAGGNFTYTGEASGLGNVTVNVTNLWGLSAYPAYLTVTSMKPAISNLTAHWNGPNMYT